MADLLSSVLAALDIEAAVFDDGGRSLYSCIEDEGRAAAVARYARAHLPVSMSGARVVLGYEGEQLLLHARRIDVDGTGTNLFSIAPRETFAERVGIDYRNADEVERDYGGSVMGIVGDGAALSPRLQDAYRHGATIMLEGEAGTGKTQLAELLYIRGEYASQPFVHIACEALNDRNWRYLLNASASPLFQNDLTLYISGLHVLGPTKTRQLIATMRGSAVCRRNRVILSGDDMPGAGESNAVARIGEELHCAVCIAAPVRELTGNAERIEAYLAYVAHTLETDAPTLDTDARETLNSYAWPRNYVQLREVAERLFIVAAGGAVDAATVSEVLAQEGVIRHAVAGPSNMEGDFYVLQPLAETDRAIARLVLEYLGGNKTKTAEVLGISRTTLWRLLKDGETAHGVE